MGNSDTRITTGVQDWTIEIGTRESPGGGLQAEVTNTYTIYV